MCEHILIRKVSMTLIACYTSAVHRIVVDGLIHGIVMHNRGLGNPIMGVLRLAPATVVRAAGTAVGPGATAITAGCAIAAGLGLGRARVPA